MLREPVEEQWIALLVLWWRYEAQYSPVQGYPKECPSARDYRASRQYDDDNGAAETDRRGKEAAMVGRIVNAMEEPYRTALYTLARNRATGVSVWKSARLPADTEERARVVAEALERFGLMV